MQPSQKQPYWWDGMNRWRYYCLILLCCLILPRCSAYRDHFAHEQSQIQIDMEAPVYTGSSTLFITPDASLQQTLLDDFSRVKERLWVEIYTWTDTRTIDALIEAHRRWVDTRVILEGSVYGTPTMNQKTYQKLQNSGIPIVYADNTRYTFTHAKFWVMDHTFCISTGNLTITGYKKNRDLIYCDNDSWHLNALVEVFLADFSHEKPLFSRPIPPTLGLSPSHMRAFVTDFIRSSQDSLVLYVQTLSDPELLGLLEDRARDGVSITICVADRSEDNESFTLSGITYRTVQKPYLHAKLLIRDRRDILIGSMNLTENALDNNREVWIILKKNDVLRSRLEKIVSQDCGVPKFAK